MIHSFIFVIHSQRAQSTEKRFAYEHVHSCDDLFASLSGNQSIACYIAIKNGALPRKLFLMRRFAESTSTKLRKFVGFQFKYLLSAPIPPPSHLSSLSEKDLQKRLKRLWKKMENKVVRKRIPFGIDR